MLGNNVWNTDFDDTSKFGIQKERRRLHEQKMQTPDISHSTYIDVAASKKHYMLDHVDFAHV